MLLVVWSSREAEELDDYLAEKLLPNEEDFDILMWWKCNGSKFPILQKIARDILAVPISTVASESAFSMSGNKVTKQRSRLKSDTLGALMCSQSWLRKELEGKILKHILMVISYMYINIFYLTIICIFQIKNKENRRHLIKQLNMMMMLTNISD